MAKPRSKAGVILRKEPEVRQLRGMAVTKPGAEEEAYRQAIKRRQAEIRRKVRKET